MMKLICLLLLLALAVCFGCEEPGPINPTPAEDDSSMFYLNPGKGLRPGIEVAPGFYFDIEDGELSPGFEL